MLGSTLSPSLVETVFLFQHVETNLHTSTAGSLGRSKMSIRCSVWASSLADLGFFVGRGQRERVSLAYVCMCLSTAGVVVLAGLRIALPRGVLKRGLSKNIPAPHGVGVQDMGRKMQMEKMVEGDHQQLAVLKGRLRTWWD
jgi:hypothetical protein